MTHRRKSKLRRYEPNKLDAPCVMFAYSQTLGLKWHDWRFRQVSLRRAQEMVKDGEAEVITREHKGKILTMYRETQPCRASRPSPCTLTLATMLAAAANEPGAHLTPSQHAHIVKLTFWPITFDHRNPATITPRMDEAHRNAGRALWARIMGPSLAAA